MQQKSTQKILLFSVAAQKVEKINRAAVLNSEGKKNKNRYRPDSLILIS